MDKEKDKRQTELLTDVLHALFGPTLKGKYLVTIKGSKDFEANDRQDAIMKAKKYYIEHLDELIFDAIKIEDLLK